MNCRRIDTVVIVYGPKAAGKSHLARILERELGIHHIDPDELVLQWICEELRPHPADGWLQNLLRATEGALRRYDAVSIEATGAWDSDWKLRDLLTDAGHNVITIRLLIDRATAMARLSARKEVRVPVSTSEAERIWKETDARKQSQKVDLEIDASDSDFAERAARYLREKLAS